MSNINYGLCSRPSMGPLGSLDICIYKSFDFKGRARRSEFFWYAVFYFFVFAYWHLTSGVIMDNFCIIVYNNAHCIISILIFINIRFTAHFIPAFCHRCDHQINYYLSTIIHLQPQIAILFQNFLK